VIGNSNSIRPDIFSTSTYAESQFSGISVLPTIDFWTYIVIFKMYYKPMSVNNPESVLVKTFNYLQQYSASCW